MSTSVTSVFSEPRSGAGPPCAFSTLCTERKKKARLHGATSSLWATKQALFPWLGLSFPAGAGAHTPQLATASKTGRGDQGAGTHAQGGAPGKKSPIGAGPPWEENSERGRGLGALGVMRGGGSPMAVSRGGLGEGLTGLEAGPKKETSSPVRSGLTWLGKGSPRPAPRAPTPAPPPPCLRTRRRRPQAPASARHRKCGAARREVRRARRRPAGPERGCSVPWCPEGNRSPSGCKGKKSTRQRNLGASVISLWQCLSTCWARLQKRIRTNFSLLIRCAISSAEKLSASCCLLLDCERFEYRAVFISKHSPKTFAGTVDAQQKLLAPN